MSTRSSQAWSLGSLVFRPVPLGAIEIEFGRPSGLDKGVKRGLGAWWPPCSSDLASWAKYPIWNHQPKRGSVASPETFLTGVLRACPQTHGLKVVMSAGGVHEREAAASL